MVKHLAVNQENGGSTPLTDPKTRLSNNSMTENKTILYFPKGEWGPYIIKAFQYARINLETPSPDSLIMNMSGSRIPISWFKVRASEIPTALNKPYLNGRGGITGTDIATVNNYFPSWEFPLYQLANRGEFMPKPRIVLATTPKFFEELPDGVTPQQAFDVKRMQGNLWTPKSISPITRSWLAISGANLAKVKIEDDMEGSIEGWSSVDKQNLYMADICNSGKTIKQNGCDEVATIMQVTLGFLQQKNLSRIDQERIDDLREAIYQAAQGGEKT